jgi:hypothetical protein
MSILFFNADNLREDIDLEAKRASGTVKALCRRMPLSRIRPLRTRMED